MLPSQLARGFRLNGAHKSEEKGVEWRWKLNDRDGKSNPPNNVGNVIYAWKFCARGITSLHSRKSIDSPFPKDGDRQD